jgi:hypothetical protein
VSLGVIAGWGGVVRAGRWAPFIVTVDNGGPAIAAQVSLEVFRGSELRGTSASRSFIRTVDLPARSRRRFSFTAPIESVPRPAVLRVTTGDGENRREIARLEVDLRKIAVNERIVVAVSSELAFDVLAREGARVVYPHAENLPDSWQGWSGVDLVVVRDTALHRLGAAQVTALEQWVLAGGTLVLTGGTTARQLPSSGLADLLPVDLGDLAERAGLPSLGRLAGAAPPTGRVALAGSRARDGTTVLAAEGGIPVVAVRRSGAGSVAWLAVDPADRAIASWPGSPALWRVLAGDAAGIPAGDTSLREPLDDPWIAPLAARSEVSFPPHAWLAVFLAAFLLPALAVLLVPRPLGTRLRAGLLALLAVIASGAGWYAFNRKLFRGDDFLLEAAWVRVSDGSGRVSRHLAVCAPSGGAFVLELGGTDAMVDDISASGPDRPPGSLAIELGTAATVRSVSAGRFGSRLIAVESIVPFALSAVVVEEEGGPWLTVENRTGAPIRQAFLVTTGRLLPLGDLPTGVSSRFAVPAAAGIGQSGNAVVIADAGRRSFWERESATVGLEGPVLVGWLDEPPLPVRLGGKPARASVCMVTLEVARR